MLFCINYLDTLGNVVHISMAFNCYFRPVLLLNQVRAHSRLWAHAWFTEIVLRKVCVYVCMHVCMYICLSVRTHVNKALEAKSSLFTRNKGYTEPVLNL